MTDDGGVDWVLMLDVALNIVLPLLATLLFPYLRRLLVQRAERDQHADLAIMAARVVLAAEQQFGLGTERLDYAMKTLANYASNRGIRTDYDTIRALVEAAVFVMNSPKRGSPEI